MSSKQVLNLLPCLGSSTGSRRPPALVRKPKMNFRFTLSFGVVVQRIGHIPSKDTMMVRFHPALPPDMLKTPIRAFF